MSSIFALLFFYGNSNLLSLSNGFLFCYIQNQGHLMFGKISESNLIGLLSMAIWLLSMIVFFFFQRIRGGHESIEKIPGLAYDFCEELLSEISLKGKDRFGSIEIDLLKKNLHRFLILKADSKLGHVRLIVPMEFALLTDNEDSDGICGCHVMLLEYIQGFPDAKETAFLYRKETFEMAFATSEKHKKSGLYINGEDYVLRVLPEGSNGEVVRRRVKRFYRDIKQYKDEIDFIEKEQEFVNTLLGDSLGVGSYFELYKSAKELTQRILNELYSSTSKLFEYIQEYTFDIFSDSDIEDVVEKANPKSSDYYQTKMRHKEIQSLIEEYVTMKDDFPRRNA
ncbi:MAG: hypothetical protein AAGG51_26220 [Cyanobacteria bacterium P01_G01_bin.54]